MSKLLAFLRQHGVPVAIMILILLNGSISYKKGHEAGSAATQARWQAEYNKLLLNNQQLAHQTASLQHALDTQSAQFERRSHEEKQTLMADYKRRLAAVSNHVERVYIPARIPAGYCDNARATTAGTAPGIREERCELDPAVVERLAGIARDGDIAIIERNELIDRYNTARAALIQQKQQIKAP